jgi:uncharacterized membrane protein
LSYPHLVHPETRRLVRGAFEWIGLPGDYGIYIAVIAVTLIASVRSFFRPSRGVRPLLVSGGLLAAVIIVWLVMVEASHAALWPVILGSAAFLYLWWLATLLFDLVFVWHQYVRKEAACDTMRSMTPEPKTSE